MSDGIAAVVTIVGLAFMARCGWTLAGRILDLAGLGDKVAELHNHYANCNVTVANNEDRR